MYDIISQTPNPHGVCISSLAAANLSPAQRSDASDGDHDPDLDVDPDEARDYADHFPLSDRNMEEDNQILATLLKQIPSCKTVADIIIHDVIYNIIYDILLCAGLCGITGALPKQSEPGGIIQRKDRF
jgi:hypothetical protein